MGFPDWCRDPEHLPTLEEIDKIPNHWNWCKSDFIHHNPLWTPFQVLNKEFIEGLSKEITELSKSLDTDNVSILEVWAWNWRLSYFLKKELTIDKVKKQVRQIATDDFSWHEWEDPYIWVRKIDWMWVNDCNIQDSLSIYKPNIVISSWMPDGQDWTQYFRNNPNIDSFILIWNPGQCWKKESWESCDNFTWKEINITWNICWEDMSFMWNSDESYSNIVIFKRNKKNTQ